jgi:cytochrome oxidase assembly protein ShyY1
MLLAAVLTFVLADWQWRRAQLHRAQLVEFAAHTGRADPLVLRAEGAVPDMSRVQLDAEPLGAALLLQNSLLDDGRAGVRVLQPYLLSDGSAVLVDRGWLAEADAHALPQAGELRQTGRWLASPRRFTLPGATIGASGRIDALDLGALRQRLARPLRQGVVVLDHTVAPLMPWPQRPDVDPARNDGYALQWILMSLGLFAAALCTAWRRRRS